ncbi:Pc21g00470, partial [Penicillium rubens Wisconsin 54-1255]
ALESKELLAICLRKLRGLNKVRIIDASFIWTEPHSKRLRVKITIQTEAFQGTIVQQQFEVEYVVANQQCSGYALPPPPKEPKISLNSSQLLSNSSPTE